jgi:flagellar biosynthetic protein FlhB
MAQTDQDRSHAATPHKLDKAREQGQVAKSPDVIAAIVLATALLYMTWQGPTVWQQQFQLDHALMAQMGRVASSPETLWPLIQRFVGDTLRLAAPFLTALVLAAIIANVIQTGPVLSADPIKPDWERLNPVTGFKRLMTVRTLFLALRAILKLGLLGVVAYYALRGLLPQFFHLSALPPSAIVRTLLDDCASLGLRLTGMLALIALLDVLHTRREFAKKMRMSHREIKDEVKNREGDPRIRSRVRELRREMLKRSLSLRKTSNADVLITNPTHVAVALRYVHGEMSSPQLIAKGRGFMAAAMRTIAARHGIPVVQNPPLARALYQDLALNQHVHPAQYAQVARIIVWVFSRRDAMRTRRPTPSARSAWTS